MQWKDVFRIMLTLDSKSLAAGIEWRLTPYVQPIQMQTDRLLGAIMERRLDRVGETDWQTIPVVINNFNRLICLQRLLAWLEQAGMKNVIVLDNASTYPPLLDFYRKNHDFKLIHLGANLGYQALWKSKVFSTIRNNFYVYTDPDVVPVESCPLDAVAYLYRYLRTYPFVGKVGLGLKIDDLPEHFADREKVKKWEAQYWCDEIEPGLYRAKLDTTFALYRPRARGGFWPPALRTGGSLIARHLPWYVDSAHLNDEEQFYRQFIHKASSHWAS